jgi:uncharacterized protein
VTPVLVDASFLVAVYNKSDQHHARCVRALAAVEEQMATCEAVIAESLHLLRFARGAAESILASIEQGGLEIPFKLAESSSIVWAIMKKYGDVPADFADACLIAMADALDTGDILTLDSDFKHYRWRRRRRFHMLVPLD